MRKRILFSSIIKTPTRPRRRRRSRAAPRPTPTRVLLPSPPTSQSSSATVLIYHSPRDASAAATFTPLRTLAQALSPLLFRASAELPMHLLIPTLTLFLSLAASASAADGTQGGGVSLWCVARNDADDASLQRALDWACSSSGGAGGIDCSPVQQGGACFDPDDLQFHASYAFNEYYLRHSNEEGSCDFASNALLSQMSPARSFQSVSPNCKFAAIVSAGNGSFIGNASGDEVPSLAGGGADQTSDAGRRGLWPHSIGALLVFWTVITACWL